MELPIWEMKLMPRRPLLKLPGVPLHIIQRGNKRAACFFATKDYGCYLHHLQHLCQAEGVVLHAYVLMTNHVHLLLTPQQIKNVVCQVFNVGSNEEISIRALAERVRERTESRSSPRRSTTG